MAYHLSLMTLDGVHISETMTAHMPLSAWAAARLAVPEGERIIVVAHTKGGATYVETRVSRSATVPKAIVRKYYLTISTDTPR